MPRYFLHIRYVSGEDTIDSDGSVFPSLSEAIRHAIIGSRDLLADELRTGELLTEHLIQICNEDGAEIAAVYARDVFGFRGNWNLES